MSSLTRPQGHGKDGYRLLLATSLCGVLREAVLAQPIGFDQLLARRCQRTPQILQLSATSSPARRSCSSSPARSASCARDSVLFLEHDDALLLSHCRLLGRKAGGSLLDALTVKRLEPRLRMIGLGDRRVGLQAQLGELLG